MEPNDQQKQIIYYDSNSVIVASPGSGKTFVMSEKIKINLKTFLEHEGLIAISYTNKASNELERRSLSKGENPMSSFFGTIDKFYLSEIIIPFGKHIFGIPTNDFAIIKISSLPKEEQNQFNWFERSKIIEHINEDVLSVLKKYYLKGKIFIETIGLLANYIFNNSLASQKYIRARYKYIYIDEYQDSGFEQHQLFLKFSTLGLKAFAVGDLNQSIYEFSGKKAKYLKDLTGNKNFKFFELNKNHRCHKSIINYSNYLLNPKTDLIETKNNHVHFFRINGAENSIANWIDSNINNFKNHFKIEKENQIAILTRGNRTSDIINSYLKIPHKLSITNDLDISLNIWSGIFSNLLLFLYDNKYKFIEVIEEFTSFDKINKIELRDLIKYKMILKEIFLNNPIDKNQLKFYFIEIAKIIAPQSENFESIELLMNVLNSPIELNSYIPSKDNEINIMTLHKSKGLEFDLVIHLDLYEWVFPNKRPGPNNDFNNPIFDNWIQDLNLHYVGITRARKGCILISSTKRTNNSGEIKTGNDSEFLFINNINKLRC